MTTDLPFVVEGRFCACSDDFLTVKYEPVAAFKYESDAKEYIRAQVEENGQNAQVDRMYVRMKAQ